MYHHQESSEKNMHSLKSTWVTAFYQVGLDRQPRRVPRRRLCPEWPYRRHTLSSPHLSCCPESKIVNIYQYIRVRKFWSNEISGSLLRVSLPANVSCYCRMNRMASFQLSDCDCNCDVSNEQVPVFSSTSKIKSKLQSQLPSWNGLHWEVINIKVLGYTSNDLWHRSFASVVFCPLLQSTTLNSSHHNTNFLYELSIVPN